MLIPKAYLQLIYAGLALVAVLLVWYFSSELIDFVRAPLQTQLDVSTANNAGFKASAEHANKGVDGLKAAETKRKATSSAAIAGAGKAENAAAAKARTAPAQGATDYERAVNRIDRELGLK